MTAWDTFWEFACDFDRHIWYVVMFMIFLFLLTVVSLLFAEPGTVSYGVAILNLVLITALGGMAGGMYWYCARHWAGY